MEFKDFKDLSKNIVTSKKFEILGRLFNGPIHSRS